MQPDASARGEGTRRSWPAHGYLTACMRARTERARGNGRLAKRHTLSRHGCHTGAVLAHLCAVARPALAAAAADWPPPCETPPARKMQPLKACTPRAVRGHCGAHGRGIFSSGDALCVMSGARAHACVRARTCASEPAGLYARAVRLQACSRADLPDDAVISSTAPA